MTKLAQDISRPRTPPEGGHGEHEHEREAHGHTVGFIEWEDTMEDVNRMTNPSNMRWLLVDGATRQQKAGVDCAFTVEDRVKIRIVNEMDSDHPMHHPFHIHGAGRYPSFCCGAG